MSLPSLTSLNFFSPLQPVSSQMCFCHILSGESHFPSAVLDTQHGCQSCIPAISTCCASNYWPTRSLHCSPNPLALIGRRKGTLYLFHALWCKLGSACSTRPCWCASPSLAPAKVLALAGASYRHKTSNTVLLGTADRGCEKWMQELAGSNRLLWWPFLFSCRQPKVPRGVPRRCQKQSPETTA